MAKVSSYTRRGSNGRQVKVGRHRRKLRPARARVNASRAYQSTRMHRHSDAAAYAGLAVAELAAWVTVRGVAFAFITVALALVGLGVAMRRTAQ